jgi:hypothetical protein
MSKSVLNTPESEAGGRATCSCRGSHITPLLVGVGVKVGPQVLSHAIRAGVLANPDLVSGGCDTTVGLPQRCHHTVEESNTVGSGGQGPAVTETLEVDSQAAQPVAASRGITEAASVLSRSEVRQGDPSRSLLLALAIQSALGSVQFGILLCVLLVMYSCRTRKRQFRKRSWTYETW